ncbi:hypothetical protein E7T09_08475 [Deinococcus sp. KSM4-11]|uniref:hypothetical protein n=1 Tax=Deinococcus sp. KSM4-11 TaxID=2568654 RepID=UPI0010A2EF01|nr:hypothetical protein [Deinococcus sp. KSM4-11]THF87181.1 hypothetical protein E7T09_08475 [Deinococcus sp. KSM4-11]
MPFSDEQFAAAWTILEDRWNRKHNSQTVKIYREILDAELTADQFGEACRAAFRFETFFPTPQKLVDYGLGKGDFQERAIVEWDEAISRVARGLPSTEAPGLVRDLIRSVCNGEQLGMVPARDLAFARKEFIERRTAQLSGVARHSTPALPRTVEVGRVLQ